MKIYKFKDRYVVYLPFEVIKQLNLQGDEEVDFFKFNDKAFLFSKKEDITKLLMNATAKPEARAPYSGDIRKLELGQDEIGVLKKLDTLRYSNRTVANVAKLLNESEKKVLQNLMNKKIVLLFRDKKEGAYSISKEVYDKFLMRKKSILPPLQPQAEVKVQKAEAKPQKMELLISKVENENVKKLEMEGFVVLPTEAEASSLSLAVEDSIRAGKVLGIRAFNRKFYIVLRAFFDKSNAKILKELKGGPKSVSEIVKSTSLDEDAVRAILYLLSEQGDVSERRRDVFTLI